MKMRFQRHGRQFFFFTFCVEGRRPLLSRICKGRGSAPEPPGAPAAAKAHEPPGAPAAAEVSAPPARRLPAASGTTGATGGAGGGAPRPLHGGGKA